MSSLTAAQFSAAFGQQPQSASDLHSALTQMPTTQVTNTTNAASALEQQLHMQQHNLPATIMH
jgi:hypothetical protein